MNQRTHTWLAVRAVDLIDQFAETKALAELLKPYVKTSAIGAWIPDLQDSKLGSGDVDNHILKMKPYHGPQEGRFKLPKQDLLKNLGKQRMMYQFLSADTTLSAAWWDTAYKATPQPGQHLANRAMALSMTLIDFLILGDKEVAKLVPGTIAFAKNVAPAARSSGEQIATYFFMLSHFIADACMPCHCDARDLADYNKGLHKELEAHWSKRVGTYFDKKKLLVTSDTSSDILAQARNRDQIFGLNFPTSLPDFQNDDVWEEILMVCRASFAMDCILAPVNTYPFGSAKKTSFEELFTAGPGQVLLGELDQVVMQDAVLNIAIVWRNIWMKFK